MNCSVCGSEIPTDEQRCLQCGEMEDNVQVLTMEEKKHFNGITLVQGRDQQTGGQDQYQNDYRDPPIYNTHFKIIKMGLLTKVVIGIILAMILAVVVFVALPIAILVIGIGFLSLYFVRR